MNKSTKALLLSALIFPGTGHIYLKQLKRGYTILVIAFICLSLVVVNTVNQALRIVEKLQQKGGLIDIQQATEFANQAAQNSEPLLIQLAIYLLIICWLFGIIDAYRLGNKTASEDIN